MRDRRRDLASCLCITVFTILVGAVTMTGFPASSAAATSCTFDNSVGVLQVNIGVGGRATILRDQGRIEMNDTSCLDGITAATVDNTETISISGDTGGETAIVSMQPGRFEPGRTDEAGESDEIEILVDLSGGNGDLLRLRGRDREDVIVAGSAGSGTSVNLNGKERDGVDPDVSIEDNVESIDVYGLGDFDRLKAIGGLGTGSVLVRAIRLVGGDDGDFLIGGAGNDVLDDRQIHGDADLLNGNAGQDLVLTRDGDGRDRAKGGPGEDTCRVDGRDVVLRC